MNQDFGAESSDELNSPLAVSAPVYGGAAEPWGLFIVAMPTAILIDGDFVPAAKLARREGIDFILDPMWASIRDDLHEHIDGLRSVFQKPPASVGCGHNASAANNTPSANS